MVNFKPFNNIYQDIREHKELSGGCVYLYHAPNFFESEWVIQNPGGYSHNIFIIPPGFGFNGSSFYYNFGMRLVNKSLGVTGYIKFWNKYGDDWRADLNDGRTESFYQLEPCDYQNVELKTDSITRLPYLIKPAMGYIRKEEICYFTPIGD